ncbi:MAG: hypothetical protein JXR58_02675 [Bacteroidales bacterium]|nr:hypothetical protein [Bacteroidales bacterium]
MLKLFLCKTFLLIFCFGSLMGQEKDTCNVIIGKDTMNICEMDRRIANIPTKLNRKLDSLVNYLNQFADNDFERTYLYYTYIGEYIKYDLEKAKRVKRKKVKSILAPKELLSKKKGVCGDVAYLFQAMCEKSDVTSRVVFGYSSGKKIKLNIKKKRMNHAWNTVRINDNWYHIDATWGMKKYSDAKKDKPFVNYYFYLTPSDKFNKSHLSADPAFQLSNKPESWSHFKWKFLSFGKRYYSNSFSYSDTLNKRIKLDPVDELISSANSSLQFIPQNKYTILQLLHWPADDFTDKRKQDKKKLDLDDYYKARKIYKSIINYCNSLNKRKAAKYKKFYIKKLEKVEKKINQLEKYDKNIRL